MTEHTSSGNPSRAHRPLAGSTRAAAPRARDAVPLAADAVVDVTLVLRRRAGLPADVVTSSENLTRADLGERFGADPADVETVRSVVEGAGLTVASVDAASRRVQVRGPVDAVTRLFDVDLREVTSQAPSGAEVRHRQREGTVSLPEGLDGVVTAVLGLDDRPTARAQFRLAPAASPTTSYSPLDLARVYEFPEGDGAGTEIAVLELGGGYRTEDLDAYFAGLGLATPAVRAVGVDGGANTPGSADGADGEVMLDLEVAGAMAPGAALVVYFAPNTDRGFLDALSEAVHADPTPAVVSISWGGPEDSWTEQARTAFDDALADAAALGVTVTVAAGDNGSADGVQDGAAHADFPAASPHALACGGTSLHARADGTVTSEVVWNGRGATGGGVSAAFPLPAWQDGVGVPTRAGGGGTGRGVPDVAGVADPATGYRVRVDGADQVIGGTSAVAPLWAALVARLVAARGSGLGLLQPRLYAGAAAGTAPEGFRDITEGDNGDYAAGPGWDACTGLGVPVGTALRERLA
jgi:kumamolisin